MPWTSEARRRVRKRQAPTRDTAGKTYQPGIILTSGTTTVGKNSPKSQQPPRRQIKRQPATKKRSKPLGSPKAPRVKLPRRSTSPVLDVTIPDPSTPPSNALDSHGILLGSRIIHSFPVPWVQQNGTITRTEDVLFLGTVVDYCPVPPGLKVEEDRSRGCRLQAGGLDIGLYRVRFDDGDIEDMDPDATYQGYVLYEKQRTYRMKPHEAYQQKPHGLSGNKGEAVIATDAGAPEGTEATPQAGERELVRHKNPSLNREALLELDQERLGYWEYFRVFNEMTGVERPAPLASNPDAKMGSPPSVESGATGGTTEASAARDVEHSSTSFSGSGSRQRRTAALHVHLDRGKVAMPQRMPGSSGNFRRVMQFRVSSSSPLESLAGIADRDEETNLDTRVPTLIQNSSQTPGEPPSDECCCKTVGDDDGYVTADEFPAAEEHGQYSKSEEKMTEGSLEKNNKAKASKKSDAKQDGGEMESHSMRRRTESTRNVGGGESHENDCYSGVRVKHEDGAVRVKRGYWIRPGLVRRVWRAIIQG